MIALPLAMVVVVAVAMALTDHGPDSILRHLYLVPTVCAALTRGAVAGGLIGALAGLLHAPVVLPSVERAGLTPQTLDGLLSLGFPVLAGLLVGYLADDGRAHAARLDAILAIQRRLAHPGSLEEALAAAAEEVRVTLGARRGAVLVGPDVETAARAAGPVGPVVVAACAAA